MAGLGEGESPPRTMTLYEDLLREVVVTRCLRDWIAAEVAKGITVDAYEALTMHGLMESVIRTYQTEVRGRLSVAAAAPAASASAGSLGASHTPGT